MKFIKKLDDKTFIEYDLSTDNFFSLKKFWRFIRIVGTFIIGMVIFYGLLLLLSLAF